MGSLSDISSPRRDRTEYLIGKLALVPSKPGVYLFKDRGEGVLYVGKAKELKNRLRSYFQKSSGLDFRKTAMMKEVRDFEYTVTENELEAFVLESNLIKQYRPRYNVVLRDDKSYPYLKLTVNERWPRLEVVRRIARDGALYFGPYVPTGPMWRILSFIRNNFAIRTCDYSLEKRMRPCIQHQIKKCAAPCSGEIDHEEYMNTVDEVRLLLEGKNRGLRDALEKKMAKLSSEMKYEEAALVRDRIAAIQKISETQKAVAPGLGDIDVIGISRKVDSAVFKMLFIRNGVMIGSKHFSFRGLPEATGGYLMKTLLGQFYRKEVIPPPEIACSVMPEDSAILESLLSEKRGGRTKISVPSRGLKRKLVSMAEENATIIAGSETALEEDGVAREVAALLGLEKVPRDIGAFDISNIAGREAVGAFVYWAEGSFRKDRYRHIKMDAVAGPDDFAMMREMVRRTIRSLEGALPDLIIIDGGRGHLDAALGVFHEQKIERDVAGLAKDPDRIFLGDRDMPVGLEDGSRASLLLRRIRDEVHRFAIRYHKKLRAKKVFESPLEKIPGIAKKRRFELLRHFGSLEAIRGASVEEIAALRGFNRKIAERLFEALKSEGKL